MRNILVDISLYMNAIVNVYRKIMYGLDARTAALVNERFRITYKCQGILLKPSTMNIIIRSAYSRNKTTNKRRIVDVLYLNINNML